MCIAPCICKIRKNEDGEGGNGVAWWKAAPRVSPPSRLSLVGQIVGRFVASTGHVMWLLRA